jgi:hypothetical protein
MAGADLTSRRSVLKGAAVIGLAAGAPALGKRKAAPLLAPRPPMGWNSWNSFATTITEAQALEVARIQAEQLLPVGYDVFTIDIQWYEDKATGYAYSSAPEPSMDGYGRLIPGPHRFPSSAGGKGFRAIADKIHALGLKFGVHLMRGIPRAAVARNLPVLGTSFHAADIANTASVCPWNPDMYGVDMTKPGAQGYYDSVFALFASWGVDFVKMDDMSRPYDAHLPEIEAAHRAIQHSGRAMVLSLSPGETPIARGPHVREHAQMWRISDDFWDEWRLLKEQFVRLESWNQYRRPGAWPDADMLPLGRLALDSRDTKFTADEQRTLMTLWSIARAPLIMGGDLRKLDAATLALLTNREVIAVDQHSRDNQPHFLQDDMPVWTARAEVGGGCYLAVFNTADKAAGTLRFPLARLGLRSAGVRDLWAGRDLGRVEREVVATVPPHGAVLYGLSG